MSKDLKSNQILKKIEVYSDQFSLVHLYPYPDRYGSQNGPMYTGLVWLLYKELYGVSIQSAERVRLSLMYVFKQGEYLTTPISGTPGNFSHDNMTGIVALYSFLDASPRLGKYNFRQWWHPRDVSFYLYAKFPYLFWFLLPISSIAMIVSCAQSYKFRNNKYVLKTDGKILTLMRCLSFKSNPILKFTFSICTWIIEQKKDFRSWENIIQIYFKDKNHPARDLVKEWEKQ